MKTAARHSTAQHRTAAASRVQLSSRSQDSAATTAAVVQPFNLVRVLWLNKLRMCRCVRHVMQLGMQQTCCMSCIALCRSRARMVTGRPGSAAM